MSLLLIFLWFCLFVGKQSGFCAIETTLKLIKMYIKGWHMFHFNILSYFLFTVASHTAGRVLAHFYQNSNNWFYQSRIIPLALVSTHGNENPTASVIAYLPTVTCWSQAPKILLNLKSSGATLVNLIALSPGFAHVWCCVHTDLPLTGPPCLCRAALWASQWQLVLSSTSGWAALPIPGLVALPAVGDAYCRATFKLLWGFFFFGGDGGRIRVEMRWVEKAPYQRGRDCNKADS